MNTQHNTKFRCIGAGCCGSVWTPEIATTWVIKCEDGGDRGRSVANDQVVHHRVLTADGDDYFEADHRLMSYLQERIPVVPLEIRELLITRYCPQALQDTARASRENEDCLIRMHELGLDTDRIAQVLARTLAHCYWRAHVDANDVEFVLAPATAPTRAVTCSFSISGLESQLVIWMLDFDCVRVMSQDREGIQQAVKAFYQNDAYFPRPHFFGHTKEDVALWKLFCTHFVDQTMDILGVEGRWLADEWVRQMEEEGKRRAAKDEECACR
ncbi:hypothetical protein CC86DRAFT_392881 [Ophiobolus disseminans]|uniref:DUF3669 domain-containing protein n=1 Tax=Ophiobolus disseminans TaxID=1469910 RepID=A0A6A7A5S3_9PLEO|nr:hypothetical protein CC86DRAFT_392881 [Ophiobolus disseminans]